MNKKKLITTVVIALTLYLIVSISLTIHRLFNAGGRVTQTENQLQQLSQAEYQLRQELEQVTSTQYQEKAIRNQLHLSRPGETVIILPQDYPVPSTPQLTPTPAYFPNWQKWFNKFK